MERGVGVSCAAGPFVCVPSLLGPSERVSGGTRSASGWLIASSCLCLSDLVWIYSIWSVSAGAPMYLQPGSTSPNLSAYLPVHRPALGTPATALMVVAAATVWAGWRALGQPTACSVAVPASWRRFSFLPMSRWRRSSAAGTDVRFSTGDTVVRPSS